MTLLKLNLVQMRLVISQSFPAPFLTAFLCIVFFKSVFQDSVLSESDSELDWHF